MILLLILIIKYLDNIIPMFSLTMKNKRTKNKRTKNKRTKNKRNKRIYNTMNLLKSYLLNITNGLNICPNQTKCIIPDSKSGQQISICKKKVYKGPPTDMEFLIILNKQYPYSIQVHPYTMNLLIQNVINVLIDKKRNFKINDVEHYTNICLKKGTYMLESKKSGFSPTNKNCQTLNNNCYNTLEDYLIKSRENIDINRVVGWLEEVFIILDKLYDSIQFHHCDAKAAQILLTSDGHATVADLDKITFTLNINNIPYRILLGNKNNIVNKNITLLGKILKLNHITKMRYENYPRKNCIYEKYCFLSSTCLLSSSKIISEEIYRQGINLINKQSINRKEKNTYITLNIPDNFDFSSNNIKTQRSLRTSISFITHSSSTSLFKKTLKSEVYLTKTHKMVVR
jgi:hypothetical protein